MAEILIDEALAAQLAEFLRRNGHRVTVCDVEQSLPQIIARPDANFDLAILDTSRDNHTTQNSLAAIGRFRERHGPRPMLLCASRVHRGPRFELDLERKGARLVDISAGDLRPVAHKAEVLLLELRDLIRTGPQFRIIHRFRLPETECAPGEEVTVAYLIYRGREIVVPLTPALLLLFDYLARYRHRPLNATQIAAGMRAEPFFQKHGLNSGVLSLRKMSRSSVKEYVKQIRKALVLAFRKAPFTLDPKRVLVSRETVGKEVLYHLRATVEWHHPEGLHEAKP